MTAFEILAILTTLAALAAWLNHRFVRLPATIGLMVIGLLGSLVIMALTGAGVRLIDPLTRLLEAVDFDSALLNGMLGALLFAGALHVNLNDLADQKWVIGLLATAGVALSTVLVGVSAWQVFGWIGLQVPLIHCLLFGALISPTDPIAVGAILTRVGVSKSLETKITGESLFNDGIGVVMFLVLLGLAGGEHGPTAAGVGLLFVEEVLGGLLYGAAIGWLLYVMLKSVDNYQVEILLTLAVVTGGYSLAHHLHVSGPLAMVVAGLFTGNRGKALAMSEQTRARLFAFWELVDEFLNAVLFVLIGVEVVLLELRGPFLIAGALMIPVALGARMLSVAAPIHVLRRWRAFSPHVITILTWSGLRGGISVALALSLPVGGARPLILTVTYIVVCFSIIVQGLTVGPLIRRLTRAA